MNSSNGNHPVTSQPRATSSLIEVQNADMSIQSSELRRVLSSRSIKLRHKRRFGSWCKDECEIFADGTESPCLSAMQSSVLNHHFFCCASQEIHVVPVFYQNQVGNTVTPCLSIFEETCLSNSLQKMQVAVIQLPPGEEVGRITYCKSGWIGIGNHDEYNLINSCGNTYLQLKMKKSQAPQTLFNNNIMIQTTFGESGMLEVSLTWLNKETKFQDKILSLGFLIYYVMKSLCLSSSESSNLPDGKVSSLTNLPRNITKKQRREKKD